MKKIKILCLFLLISLTLCPLLSEARDKKPSRKKIIKKLEHKYKRWLDITTYIITTDEKNTFFNLTNNRDRDLFINLFWQQRDPSKGTPENEYKDEHMKRFNHANKRFRGAPIPGWKTDRGRIYILLGPPVSQQEVKSSSNIYPFLTWNYFGSPAIGLPTAYRVSFYKAHGAGQYKLYIPGVAQPGELVRALAGSIDLNDNSQVYEKLAKHDSEVAEAAFSMIPGEKIFNYTPSLQSPILMSKIYEQPKRKIKATYARNFLSYKGVVDIKAFTNYINCQTLIKQIYDKNLGANFIHLAVKPEHVSVDYSEEQDKYYYSFNMTVLLSDKKKTIFKYKKNFSSYYSKEQLNLEIANGLILTDTLPVIPGKYEFRCIVENIVNSEIFYYEQDIDVPNYKAKVPAITSPLVSYKVTPFNQPVTAAFLAENHYFKVDPVNTFGKKEELKFYLTASSIGSDSEMKLVSTLYDIDNRLIKTFNRNLLPGKITPIFESLPPLAPSDYRIVNQLKDKKDKVIETRETAFSVSHSANIPHPAIAMRKLSHSRNYVYNLMLANQYQNVGKKELAYENYEKALRSGKNNFGVVKSYAEFLLKDKKYSKVLEIAPLLKDKGKDNFTYFKFKGMAQLKTENYQEAIVSLLEANKIYDSDIQLLNSLGLALLMDKNEIEALKAFKASIKLHAQQPEITKLIKKIEGDQKK